MATEKQPKGDDFAGEIHAAILPVPERMATLLPCVRARLLKESKQLSPHCLL
jgi:hypothetical protein